MAETYSAGIVTAYGAAVRGGYTGTYEQWCQDMAQLGDNVSEVREKAAQVEQTAQEFTREIIPAAIQSVRSEGTAQVGAVTNAGSAQVQAVEAAGTTQTGNVNTAGAAQVQAVNDEGVLKVGAVEAAGAAQVQAVEDAGAAKVQDVNTAGATQVQAVNTAGQTALTAITQKSTEEQAAIQQKGETTLDSIPEDYTELSEDVDNLKGAKATVITNSASGAIASFEDGADGMPLKSLTVNIEPVQEGSGDPSPENVRPITGWTGCNVTRTGKNLWKPFDSQTINGVTLTVDDDGGCSLTGTATANAIFVMPVTILSGSYYLSAHNSDIVGASVRLMLVSNTGGADKQIYLSVANAAAPITLDTEYNQLRIRVNAGAASTSTKFYPQLELGSTGTAYEPFVANDIYPITFPAPDPGTVYSGSLDVTNGVLTVTHQAVTLNGSEPRWGGWTSGASTNRVQWNTYNDVGVANAIFRSDKLISNTPNETHPAWSVYGSTATARMFFTVPKSITSLDAWKAWLAENNVTVVYPLANPIQYQLTAEQVTTLLGANNIWADCGAVTVEYPADTKLYIQKINAPTDDDMTADTQIDSGKYFLIGNTLYLSTTVIPAGDTIIPGTNCTKTDLAAALNALNT